MSIAHIPFCRSELFRALTTDRPVVLLDAGASGGVDAAWEAFDGHLKVIGFDPDAEACDALNLAAPIGQTYHPVALYSEKGRKTLHVTRDRRCSSLFKPNLALLNRFVDSAAFHVEDQLEVACDSVDNVVTASGVDDIDFIKLDTQGSELSILEGAQETLNRCGVFGVDIEVEFSAMYEGQPLYAEVDNFLREEGFALFDLKTPLGRKARARLMDGPRGQVLWARAVYFRDLPGAADRLVDHLDATRATKAIALAELYGFPDFSLQLLDFYGRMSILEASCLHGIRACLLTARGASPEALFMREMRAAWGRLLSRRAPRLRAILQRIIPCYSR